MKRTPLENFKQAAELGDLARLRLRAEVMLGYGDDGTVPLTPADRERLERITASPREDDAEFLGSFDRYLEG